MIGLTQLDTITIFSAPPAGVGQVERSEIPIYRGTRPAPTMGSFPVGATLVVALVTEVRNSYMSEKNI